MSESKKMSVFPNKKRRSTTDMITDVNPESADCLFYPMDVKQGGLRTQGFFKKSYRDTPLISIVTVVYNGDAYLKDTIKSVVDQTYGNVEYIVVDGGSKDKTLDIIKNYEDAIDYWISENDQGIYHAMNKAMELVTGDFVLFLNSDDYFYNVNVLSTIAKSMTSDVEFLYGKVEIIDRCNKTIRGQKLNYKDLVLGSICHQAVFCRPSLLKRFAFFDCTYKIAADYDFFVKAFKADASNLFCDYVISSVRLGGVSSVFSFQTIKELLSVKRRHYKIGLFLKAWCYYRLVTTPIILLRLLTEKLGVISYIRQIRDRD